MPLCDWIQVKEADGIPWQELGLANDLISTLGGAEGAERTGDTASTATGTSAAGGGELLGGGWKDTLDLIGEIYAPLPLHSSPFTLHPTPNILNPQTPKT